jgi:uncharacterized membrane protein required for colicin V production
MNYVDIIVLVLLVLGFLNGYRKGAIKSAFGLIGLVVVTILAYTFKGKLASWLITFMPFYDFGGVFSGVKSINIMVYEVLSFILIFVILYCILAIILNVAGIIDKIIKKSLILAIPDKIIGALFGFIESALYVFVIVFVLSQIPITQSSVMNSYFGVRILERTPIIRVVAANSSLAAEDIYTISEEYKNVDDKTEYNINVLNILIKYRIVTSKEVQDLVDAQKIDLKDVKFG